MSGALRKTVALSVLLGASTLLAGCDYFGGQKTFATPEDAAAALIDAVKSGDKNRILRVLGDDAATLVESGDAVQDTSARDEFVERYAARHGVTEDGADRSLLVVGEDDWPFPFPIVKADGRWLFDTSSGVEEIVDRRVGRNELYTIQACLAYVDAQTEYYASNPESDSVLHYARRLLSSPGKKDGLYWEAASGEPQSPLGPAFARARDAGYGVAAKGEPFHGYYYRELEAQGPDAIDGAFDYVIGDRMTAGFALVAYPAERGSSGVLTFIVNQDGVVYSKDLGEDTQKLADEMKAFNPDATWKREDGG